MKTLYLVDERASETWAQRLAEVLPFSAVLSFRGEIGTGKTTFIRAMLRAMGVTSAIKSPTFSLVESYSCQPRNVHHFDLYRIEDEAELDYIGFRDYFSDEAICCIEWPERACGSLLVCDLAFSLSVEGGGRRMTIKALSVKGEGMLSAMLTSQ